MKGNYGFLTLAFGKTYRKLAKNLLISYRAYGNTALFCVVTDKKDKNLKDFDCVIEKKPLAKGFFNKLYLNEYTPFDETVFIDADCLFFNNVSQCFNGLKNLDSSFAPMGRNYVIDDLDRREGYFDFEKTKHLGIKYTYVFQGGFYYFNKNSSVVFETAREIAKSKEDYGFPFSGDEPCLALSMAINNCRCWNNANIKGMSWYPRAKNMTIDIKNGKINYQFGDKINIDKTDMVHFGTFNTYKPFYKSTVWTIKRKNSRFALFLYNKKIIYAYYKFLYCIKTAVIKTKNFILRCIKFLGRKMKLIFRREDGR